MLIATWSVWEKCLKTINYAVDSVEENYTKITCLTNILVFIRKLLQYNSNTYHCITMGMKLLIGDNCKYSYSNLDLK